MGSSLSSDLVSGLSGGLSEEDAQKLWKQCDKNGNGILDRGEAKKLVQLLADESAKSMAARIEQLKEAGRDPAQVDAFLNAFDISGDGKVEKDEFIKKAMEGYDIPLDLEEDEEEEAEEGGAKGDLKREASAEFHDCEEPPAKKARVGEAAPEDSHGLSAQAVAFVPGAAQHHIKEAAADPSKLGFAEKKQLFEASASAPAPAAAAKHSFKEGDKVKVVNVKTPAGKAFNGVQGVIVGWSAEKKRWKVKMPPIVVPTLAENLEPVGEGK